MSGGTTAVVIVVTLVVIALLGVAGISARRRRLRQQFGPEYERVASEQNSKIKADAELTERQRRVRKLDIRPLPEEARIRYADRWVGIQEEFVDAPQTAVQDAYALVTTVMRERGYPVDDEQQVVADLSVDHAQTVGHFRAAQDISKSAAGGGAATEDLRQAFIHYRALFSDLLGKAAGASQAIPGNTTMPAQASMPVHSATTADTAASNGRAGTANGQLDPDAAPDGTPAQDQTDFPHR